MAVARDSIVPSLQDDLTRVEAELLRVVTASEDFVTELASHLISAGGKRVRPGLCITAALAANFNDTPASIEVIRGACAVELVHIGSLYHDDVMDDAPTRRGVKSINAKWGNLQAILAGDYLLGRASELAAALGPEVAHLLATTITELCTGQILELQSAYSAERTREQYERSIAGKTASLLTASCRIGAIVASLSRPLIDALSEFGRSYGMAFQIVDDIFDIVGSSQQLGKPAGNDLLEGIYTLPVIFALDDPKVSEELLPLLNANIDMDKRNCARQLICESSGVELAIEVAQSWADKSTAALEVLPDTKSATALRAAGQHLIDRLNDVV